MSDIDPAAEFLINKTRERGKILGAQLGGALANVFPELKRRPDYPGLRRFIQRNCKGHIVRTGDHGGDDIYEYAAEGGNVTAVEPSSRRRHGVWDVYQRPHSDARLLVNVSNGDLHVAAENEIPKENFVLLPSVTAEEHKAIAQTYLERIEESQRSKFEAALAEDDYWPHWSRLINASPQKADWSAFRFEKLCELFRTKAIDAGLSAPTAEVALNHLLIGKKEKQLPRSNQPVGDLGTGAARDAWRATRGDLHRAIHVTIDRMSENELRRLWLPLGDVLDALRIPRR